MTQTIYRTTKIPVFYFKKIEDHLNKTEEFISVSEFIRESIKEKLVRLQKRELSYFLLTKDIVFNEEVITLIHDKVLFKGEEKDILKDKIQSIINRSLDMDYLKFLSKFLVNFAYVHPFKDGNKRSSWTIVDVFLRLNNKKLQLSVKKDKETKDEMFIWQNSTNQKSVDELTRFLQQHIVDYKENTEDIELEIEKSIKENRLMLKKLSR